MSISLSTVVYFVYGYLSKSILLPSIYVCQTMSTSIHLDLIYQSRLTSSIYRFICLFVLPSIHWSSHLSIYVSLVSAVLCLSISAFLYVLLSLSISAYSCPCLIRIVSIPIYGLCLLLIFDPYAYLLTSACVQ